jgi:hypothetical protein
MQICLTSAIASRPRPLTPTARPCVLPHRIIRYNRFGVVNRRLIGDDRMKARDILVLTFLLIEARRYEHAGCANRIHCR